MTREEQAKRLLVAIENRDERSAIGLIECGANVNSLDRNGWSCLMLATIYKQNDVIKKLIEHGADVDYQDKNGATCLMKAVSGGNLEAAFMLLEANADVDAKDKDGWTALMKASFLDDERFVSMLVEKGADVRAKDDYGNSVMNLTTEKDVKIIILTKIKEEKREQLKLNKVNVLDSFKGMFVR